MPVSSDIIRSRRIFTRVAIALVAALLSSAVAFASVPSTNVRLSTDPFTNSSSMHQTEVEPDTFSYGSTIVSAFQVGRFSDGGSSDIGWATSVDSGTTWTHGFLPGITIYMGGGTNARASDPSVAYDPLHGVWMIVLLPLPGAGVGTSVLVSRSLDGGLTWQNPVTAVNQSGLDKTWMTCDSSSSSPFYGHCYIEWDDNSAGNEVLMTTSSDGGLTWSAPQGPSGGVSGLGGQPLVGPDGRVIVPFSENDSGIGSFVSTNGGASWSAAVTVANVSDHGVGGNLRTSPLPSAEIDPGGRVYVAWQDCRFRSGCSSNDIVMSNSLDGLTWSAVTRIPIDAVTSTVDHFIPGLAIDRTRSYPLTHFALTYYYYPVSNCSTCQLNVGFVSSLDGGNTWSTVTQLAGPMMLNWLPLTNQGYMVGDYISTSFTPDGKAHPVFAVANAPSGGVFDVAMYSPASGLTLKSAQPSPSHSPKGPPVDKQLYFAPGDHPLPTNLPTAH